MTTLGNFGGILVGIEGRIDAPQIENGEGCGHVDAFGYTNGQGMGLGHISIGQTFSLAIGYGVVCRVYMYQTEPANKC
jgi:hypothetical protein